MTEDEAISILEEELVSASGWLTRARRGEIKEGTPSNRIYEALSALSEAWAHIVFVPKCAVLPMMQVDGALCAMNNPQYEIPDDWPNSLGDLLVEMEHMLVGDNPDGRRLSQLAAGQSDRTTEWAPNAGLQDEALAQVYDFLTGEDGVMFDGVIVLPLTEVNTQYARSIFQALVEKHSNSQQIPRALATLLLGLKGHLITWRRSPVSTIRQAELADELLELVFQYLFGTDKRRASGYEQLKWAWPEDSDQAH